MCIKNSVIFCLGKQCSYLSSHKINTIKIYFYFSVRSCRERWRTIRSSFLRSLKLSRTSTGRGKRKYYLSKYLQFLIPFTRSRLKNSSTIIAERKVAATGNMPPMTRISNMPIVSSDETKDSSNSAEVAAIAEGDVMVTLHEGAVIGSFPVAQHAALPLPLPLPLPLNLQTIKQEKDVPSNSVCANTTQIAPLQTQLEQKNLVLNSSIAGTMSMNVGGNSSGSSSNNNNHINSNNNCTNDNNNNNNNNNNITSDNNNLSNNTNPTMYISNTNTNTNTNTSNNNNNTSNIINANNNASSIISDRNITNNNKLNVTSKPLASSVCPHPSEMHNTSTVDLTEFAEWLKSKNEQKHHCLMTSSPDADQSFLNSLHPYLREMSGKQNRRFRQKVVALIDAVLDNTD